MVSRLIIKRGRNDMIIKENQMGLSKATENIIVSELLTCINDKYLDNMVNKLSMNFTQRLEYAATLNAISMVEIRDKIKARFCCNKADGRYYKPISALWNSDPIENVGTLLHKSIPLNQFDPTEEPVYVILFEPCSKENMTLDGSINIILSNIFHVAAKNGSNNPVISSPIAIPVGFLCKKDELGRTTESEWEKVRSQIEIISSNFNVDVVLYRRNHQ